MQIKLGLCDPNPGWKILLDQEGLSYEIISDKQYSKQNYYQLLLPNSEFIQRHKDIILQEDFTNIIILDKETWPLLFDYNKKLKYITYIKPGNNSLFSHLEIIDFYTQFMLPLSNDLNLLDDKLNIFYKKFESGLIVILPFSVNELIADSSSKRKRFYAFRKELPSEVVSSVSKYRIRELISKVLHYCFFQINLPLVRKSYYPKDKNNVFIFRVDTDFCNAKDAKSLYNLCQENGIRATWFIDTKNEETISEVYSKFTNQEIALHCDKHKVFESYDDNKENIETAINKLKCYDIHPKGYAAPFGECNPSLERVLESCNFSYSSEFTLNYDDLPFFPFYDNHFSSVLQVPIHPVSIGRLRRSHFTEKEMIAYYTMIIEYRLSRNLPVILYHHPHHQKLKVWEHIFKIIKKKHIWNPTMFEFSSWWKEREKILYNIEFSQGRLRVSSNHPDISYRILDFKKGSASIETNKQYEIKSLSYVKNEPLILHENERMRKFDWRDMLYNLEQKRAKKRS